jgi:hypothetical protein
MIRSITARNVRCKLLLGMVALTVTSSAWASPTFPTAVRDAVPMPCVPECTICHQTNAGGFGTLRPNGFGQNLQRDYGLSFGQVGTVAVAINGARAVLDGDKDGRLDVAELSEGGDPNSSDASAATCDQGPQYGCGAGRIAKGDSLDGMATLFAASALALGAAVLRRRLRRE